MSANPDAPDAADAPETLEKVTVFVTRDAGLSRELLVFRHPNAGVQLPAGTVEAGEAAVAAALRETFEETGLSAVAVVASLGTANQTMAANYRMVLRTTPLLREPHRDAADVGRPFPAYLGLRRGLPVRQIGEPQEGFTPVAYEEYAGIWEDTAEPAFRVTGWVPSGSITPVLQRHFFHLTPTEPTPDAWIQSAEEWEHRFELYWVPLHAPDRAGLIPSQAAWLTEYLEKLTR